MSEFGSTPPQEDAVFRLGALREVAPAAVREFLALTTTVAFPTNTTVFTQGDVLTEDAWLVVAGRLSVRVASGTKNRVVADVWPGEIVGEAALYARGRVRSATVVTMMPTTAIRISRSVLLEHAEQPAFVAIEMHLLETMAKRIRSTNTLLQRVVLEQRSSASAASPSTSRDTASPRSQDAALPGRAASTRPARPAPPERLTLAQRLARWFDTTD